LFVRYTSEVTHHTSNKPTYGSVDEVIVETGFESDFQIPNSGLLTETEFEKFADFAGPSVSSGWVSSGKDNTDKYRRTVRGDFTVRSATSSASACVESASNSAATDWQYWAHS